MGYNEKWKTKVNLGLKGKISPISNIDDLKSEIDAALTWGLSNDKNYLNNFGPKGFFGGTKKYNTIYTNSYDRKWDSLFSVIEENYFKS